MIATNLGWLGEVVAPDEVTIDMHSDRRTVGVVSAKTDGYAVVGQPGLTAGEYVMVCTLSANWGSGFSENRVLTVMNNNTVLASADYDGLKTYVLPFTVPAGVSSVEVRLHAPSNSQPCEWTKYGVFTKADFQLLQDTYGLDWFDGDTDNNGTDPNAGGDIATSTVAGMVKPGAHMTVATDGTLTYTPPVATSSATGVVKPGTGLKVAGDGTLTPTVATSTLAGVVKPGSGFQVAADGTLTYRGLPVFYEATQGALTSPPVTPCIIMGPATGVVYEDGQ
ncbi:hypothetical protein [Bifidobacterium panos]|uniref:Tail fiber protein n=1 Tax=Bifidobacterium panos TaxID=2675321 RepID=A0ABX1SY76_9BIFI|nr:hypothetical protein [Bifidobacterium sp. DSM 109963]NMN02794.1 tail fiber protein [Bifidobacterium sp. DSM 109963]